MPQVTCYDAEGQPHQKEPIDAREACLHNGYSMTPPGGAVAVEVIPTKDELLSMRDTLVRREGELDEHFERVRAQAADNVAEAGRLAELRVQLEADVAQLASDRSAFEAAKAAAPAPAAGKSKVAPAAQ